MFKNKHLNKKWAKKETLSPELKEQLDGLYVMLEERYGQGFADWIMGPYFSDYDKSIH